MVDKQLTELTDVSAIDDIQKAKDYTSYEGGQLNDTEKQIFNDSKLKNDDGTPKVDEIQKTVVLLDNLKKAQAKLPGEKESATNLTDNGNLFLAALLGEKINNSVAYQLINPQGVDKIIKEYQTIQFKRINRSLETEKRSLEIELNSIEKKQKDQTKLVAEAREKMDKHMSVEKAEKYRDNVMLAVDALKADLQIGQVGRKILDEIVELQANVANTVYRVNTTVTVPTLGSIIKTGVKNPYSDKPFTHPTYLAEGFSWQMMQLFKEFNQKKLFEIIDSKFASEPDKITKTKNAFKRIVNAPVQDAVSNKSKSLESQKADKSVIADDGKDASMNVLYALDVPGNEPHGRSDLMIARDLDEAHS
jgi:hypothetical protein